MGTRGTVFAENLETVWPLSFTNPGNAMKQGGKVGVGKVGGSAWVGSSGPALPRMSLSPLCPLRPYCQHPETSCVGAGTCRIRKAPVTLGEGSCTRQQAAYSPAPGKLLRHLQLQGLPQAASAPPGSKRSGASKDQNKTVASSKGPWAAPQPWYCLQQSCADRAELVPALKGYMNSTRQQDTVSWGRGQSTTLNLTRDWNDKEWSRHSFSQNTLMPGTACATRAMGLWAKQRLMMGPRASYDQTVVGPEDKDTRGITWWRCSRRLCAQRGEVCASFLPTHQERHQPFLRAPGLIWEQDVFRGVQDNACSVDWASGTPKGTES